MQPHKDFFSQLRKVHAGGGSSKATDPADDLEHLRTNPPQRKINAARRAHHKAVNTLVARSTDARAIALGGLEAVRQAELRTEAIDVTSSSAVPAAAARAEAADMASLRAAYAQAVGVDSSASPDRDSELKAWGLVFGIAQGIVDAAEGAASGGEVESAYRAQMTSLTRQAAIYESQGLLRSAINALERIVELAGSGSVGRDAATLRGVGSVARRLAELNARIGNVDKSRHYITLAASLSKQLPASSGAGPKAAGPAAAAPSDEGALSDEASSVSPAGAAEVLDGGARKPEHASLGSDIPAESGVSEAAEGLSRATASAAPVADAALTAAVPPAVEAAPVPPSAAESNPVAPAAAEVAAAADVPTPTPQWPSFPESDTSPPAVFTRLMTRAMFHGDFEPLKATLNRSLLGDGTASATLRLQMPGFRVTALMAAAAGDRPDIVRRVLGLYAPAEAPLQVVGVRDAAGNNALAHALHLGQLRALDELLRCAASHAPVAAAAPAASSTNLLPLSTLGLSVAQSSNVSIAAREGKLAGRELQPFAFGGEGSGSLGGLEDGGEKQGGRGGEGKGSGGRAWDQFAANEALFGVRAGFPEAAYTTTLNLAAFTPEQLARADALVASIAAGGAGADDEAGSDGSETGDEEARFSAVRRPATKAEAARADAFTDAGVAARIGAAAATSAAPPAAGSGAAAGAGKSATVAAVSGAAPAAGTASSARRGAAHAGGKTR